MRTIGGQQMSSDRAADYTKGERVQAHPATDTWMKGDCYGTVETIGAKYVYVRMDRSRRLIKFSPFNLLSIGV